MIGAIALPLLFAQAITNAVPAPAPAVTRGAPLDPKPFRYSRTFDAGAPGWKSLPLDAHVVCLSRDMADVRIATERDIQIPYVLEKTSPPIRISLPPLERTSLPGGKPDPSISVYRIELPFASMPRPTLRLQAGDPVFERDIVVHMAASGHERRFDRSLLERVFSGTYAHRDPDTQPAPFEIPLPVVRGRQLLVEVHERDNAPLKLGRAELQLNAYRLRFYLDRKEPLKLLYGAPDLRPPLYDAVLETLIVPEEALSEVRLPPPPPMPTAEEETEKKGRAAFWIALTASIAALLILVARLVRGAEPSAKSGPGSEG